jgi:hypothetical protein
MDAVTKAQIVWAETKNLRVPKGGDRATLSALRRYVAAIASEAEKTFSRFEALPAHDDDMFAQDVADCAAAAEATTPEALKNLRAIVWPSADGKTLNKDDLKPPAPWDAAAAESLELIGRFTVDGRGVSAFSRSVVAGEDTPRFVSLVTGTGLPPGTGVYIPKETPRKRVDPKATRTAFWLAIATAALFAIACTWSLSVGSVSRAAYSFFQIPDKCPTSIDQNAPATLFGAPRAWLPGADGPGDCLKAWQEASNKALAASDRDWWLKLKSYLARLTTSDPGQAYSLRIPTLMMMASIVLLAIAAGLGVLGRPLGLFIDKRNRMSLTRIQFAVWMVILVGGLASYALYNVGFWGENLSRIREGVAYLEDKGKSDQKLSSWSNALSGLLEYIPNMDVALWALIGISGGTAVVSSLIMQPGTPTAPGAGTRVMPARRTRVASNPDPKDAQLADLVYGETEQDDGVVDSTRVQAVAITGVLAAIYVNLVLEAGERIGGLAIGEAVNAGTQVFTSMPPAGTTFLWLLGISHGTLVGGKLLGAYRGSGT